ncbi:hypothetical protein EJ05DRAFT_127451 [Pseudovirgaria hyperparasitica]|uniref:Uncharacterized protein n=1 Tax=Pseudovirgaria hyperparasitica TaxID=470096 RepID=A0A6A6VYA6_9PEZI|nr:uncharacterized protein EJ05DRAFT_127451 [Pseudovirgaria hyperparasitica]KAF2755243.1 hypothetical protein EJ05DRAFT_127451 [Pseudovirgaria hyperparasitica]
MYQAARMVRSLLCSSSLWTDISSCFMLTCYLTIHHPPLILPPAQAQINAHSSSVARPEDAIAQFHDNHGPLHSSQLSISLTPQTIPAATQTQPTTPSLTPTTK